jgi:hypothetical protein
MLAFTSLGFGALFKIRRFCYRDGNRRIANARRVFSMFSSKISVSFPLNGMKFVGVVWWIQPRLDLLVHSLRSVSAGAIRWMRHAAVNPAAPALANIMTPALK